MTRGLKLIVAVAGCLALVGLALWGIPRVWPRLFGSQPSAPVVARPPQVVPDSVLVQARPKSTTTLVDRIATKAVRTATRTSEGTPDTALVRKYATAAFEAASYRDSLLKLRARALTDSATADTAALPVPPVPMLPPAWGEYDGSTLTLGFTRSDGSPSETKADIRPHFTWRAGLDSLSLTTPVVRGDRFWLQALRTGTRCGPPAVIVGALAFVLSPSQDRWQNGGIVGGATLAGCVVGRR